jgi:Zinc finger, C2H2 type
LICSDCKTELLNCYKFKKKVEESLLTSQASAILEKVGLFLNDSVSHDYSVMTRNNECLAVVPPSESMFMKFQGWSDFDPKEDERELLCEINIKEEIAEQESCNNFDGLEDDSNSYAAPEDSTSPPGVSNQRKKSPKWLLEMMEKCKNVTHTEDDGSVEAWICVDCKKNTATQTGMRVHLLKYHSKGKAQTFSSMKSEINEKVLPVRVKPNGKIDNDNACITETVKKVKTEGMWKHVVRKHVENSPSKAESESDEEEEDSERSFDNKTSSETSVKYKRDPEWIKEKIEQSKCNGSWTCCICHKLTSQTFRGIQIHIIRMHCEKQVVSRTVNIKAEDEEDDSYDDKSSDDNESSDDEKLITREKKQFWVKAMVEKSAKGEKWVCAICNKMTCKSQQGMHLHIARTHKNDIGKTNLKRKVEEIDDEEKAIVKRINAGTKKLMTLDGNQEISVCSECNNKVFESKEDFRQHIVNIHVNKSKKQKKLLNLKREMRKCKDDEGGYRCTKCDKTFSSYQAIRYHLTKKHLSVDLDVKPKSLEVSLKVSEMSPQEHMWFRLCMDKAPIGRSFQCCYCTNKTYSCKGALRYHLTKVHMPFLKMGQDKFDQHLQSCKELSNSSKTVETVAKAEGLRFLRAADMTDSEKKWLKENIRKSRVKTFDEDYWKCWICHKQYTTNSNMRYHLLNCHIPHWQLGEESFAKHLENYKDKVEDFEGMKSGPIWKLPPDVLASLRCDYCDYQFCKKGDYNSHMNFHKQTDPIVPLMFFSKCDLCPMKFRDNEDLEKHLEHHSTHEESQIIPAEGVPLHASIPENQIAILAQPECENFQFMCGHCSKKFATDTDIDRHLLLHHMNPIICPFDQRKFTKHVPFINHLHSSHVEILGRKLKCPHCKIELAGNLEKIAHLKVCDAKKYSCDNCGKRFSSRMYLMYHLKKELGILDFSCEVCGKSYASRPELEIHQRSHNPKVNLPINGHVFSIKFL